MESIRILLVGLPRMLHELLESTIRQQPDMDVVAVDSALGGPPDSWAQSRADVVIVELSDPGLPDPPRQLLYSNPKAKVFGVTVDGRRTFLFELLLHRIPIGDTSPQELVQMIRAAVRANVP